LDDGIIGPQTLSAVDRVGGIVGELALCQRYLLERIFVYDLTVQANPTLGKFLHGWLVRVKHLYHEINV
jgi:lysozyme family protein